MGRRNRQRARDAGLGRAPTRVYRDPGNGELELRGALTPATRRRYEQTLAGGLSRDDAWQRATELLFEHLAVAWTISEVRFDAPRELLGRYRMASSGERTWVRATLRAHLAEHFPDMPAP